MSRALRASRPRWKDPERSGPRLVTHSGGPERPPGRRRWRQKSLVVAVVGFACLAFSSTVLANIVDPDAPPWSGLFARGIGRGVARLLLPFVLTIGVEAPIVMFVLRKNLPLGVAAAVASVVGLVSYPLAFHLVADLGWTLFSVEVLVTAVEFLLFIMATWVLGRLEAVSEAPAISRLLVAAVAANLASTAVGLAFLVA